MCVSQLGELFSPLTECTRGRMLLLAAVAVGEYGHFGLKELQ